MKQVIERLRSLNYVCFEAKNALINMDNEFLNKDIICLDKIKCSLNDHYIIATSYDAINKFNDTVKGTTIFRRMELLPKTNYMVMFFTSLVESLLECDFGGGCDLLNSHMIDTLKKFIEDSINEIDFTIDQVTIAMSD